MLELKNIKKDYPAGDNTVHALKGINLRFRKSEFVSILGQSGCGKTTMLNIIGGLDQYTEGDLVIGGISTKDFKDRDWDAYRNHSIGFVFQSYNLIPHQTVLQNVEIALTLSGVSKSERRERAKQALKEVGLETQLNKKPSEMSGGQMQRVAIARALVNNPDIILADEPTGALDTETSVQVMEILKKISNDRLIIMVTHNPELAEKYSTRIINMLDGVITHDSAPLTEVEYKAELLEDLDKAKRKARRKKKEKKPSMSFFTSFMLSLKNLFTKKGRTLLTSFAGSIGIIGIALIYAVSEGTTTYIDMMQEAALSSYPITIEKTTYDLSSLMKTFMDMAEEGNEHENDAVYKKSAIADLVNAINSLEETENDLVAFKEFLESEMKKEDSVLSSAVTGIQYSYDLDLLIYTKNVENKIIKADTEALLTELMTEFMGSDMSGMASGGAGNSTFSSLAMSSGPMGNTGLWQELLTGTDGSMVNDVIKSQYDVIYGSWPNNYDEVVLVVDKNNELDDLTLYALGLLEKERIDEIMKGAMEGTEIPSYDDSWSYEEICDMEYKIILNADCYKYDENTGLYLDLRDNETGLKFLYDNGIALKVSGIIRANEDADMTMLTGTICYTEDLTKYVVEKAHSSEIIKEQMKNDKMDIISGLPFKTNTGSLTDAEKEKALRDHIADLTTEGKAKIYTQIMCIPSEEFVNSQIEATLKDMKREDMEAMILQGISEQMAISTEDIQAYLKAMSDEELTEVFSQLLVEQIKAQYAQNMLGQLVTMTPDQLAAALDMALTTYTTEQCAVYYDEVMEFSTSTYEDNLISMGYVELQSPAAINIYASKFEDKDAIADVIDDYNKDVEEVKKITYVDYIGMMLSSITAIINAIAYVLIAFVAISLIVSSIMIGVITLISVQERTKEIGILRAIGASKKDVSSMFNAETMIIGFTSGFLGVMVTYLLCIPINIILHYFTGIETLNAFLPVPTAIILVVISVVLTLISGIIPSRSAAKKDPVVALRSE
ncbi:MAG: ABC transporter ATP-binding protein/permease [Lachnospiraceae bacterium]|nr:ABC transporter ATP-binding protein/permease [Lachnospiraceae bacterium]